MTASTTTTVRPRLRTTAQRPRRNRPAFTLLGLLIAIGLFGTVSLIASRMVQLSFRTMMRAEAANTALMQWQQATATLRQDVWDATSLRVLGERTAMVEIDSNHRIIWKVDDKGVLSRSLDQRGKLVKPTTWREIGKPIHFREESGDLVVAAQPKSGPAEELRLPKAWNLNRGSVP